MDEIKLKPCPFCGGMSAMFTRVGDADGARGETRMWHFGIGCTECNIRLPRSDYKLAVQMGRCGEIKIMEDDRQEAADLWNRRADNG